MLFYDNKAKEYGISIKKINKWLTCVIHLRYGFFFSVEAIFLENSFSNNVREKNAHVNCISKFDNENWKTKEPA